MNLLRSVCVYCGSSMGTKEVYRQAAESMGRELVSRGLRLVYGAGSVGLMGVLARTVYERGGDVLGIIPDVLAPREVAGETIGETVIVESMHERKALMARESDAVVAMPGGYGTFEELFETWTWLQLGYHAKPVGVLNVAGYYDGLLAFVEHAVARGFMTRAQRELLHTGVEAAALLEQLAALARRAAPGEDYREL